MKIEIGKFLKIIKIVGNLKKAAVQTDKVNGYLKVYYNVWVFKDGTQQTIPPGIWTWAGPVAIFSPIGHCRSDAV